MHEGEKSTEHLFIALRKGESNVFKGDAFHIDLFQFGFKLFLPDKVF